MVFQLSLKDLTTFSVTCSLGPRTARRIRACSTSVVSAASSQRCILSSQPGNTMRELTQSICSLSRTYRYNPAEGACIPDDCKEKCDLQASQVVSFPLRVSGPSLSILRSGKNAEPSGKVNRWQVWRSSTGKSLHVRELHATSRTSCVEGKGVWKTLEISSRNSLRFTQITAMSRALEHCTLLSLQQ